METAENCIRSHRRFFSCGSPATVSELSGIKIPLHRNLATPVLYGAEGDDIVVFEVTDDWTLMFHTLKKKQSIVIASNRLHGIRVPDYSVVERIALEVPSEAIEPQMTLPRLVKQAKVVCHLGEEQEGYIQAEMPMLKVRLKPEQCATLDVGAPFLLGISLDLAAKMALESDETRTGSA